MKNKVINLFDKWKNTPNKGVKYSKILEQFLTPFAKDFSDMEYYEDILEFAISAWNFGNMSTIIPNEDFEKVMSTASTDEIDVVLLNKMIDYKVANFKEFSNFIVDYELKETSNDHILTLITQEQELYMASMMSGLNNEVTQDDYEENYINRTAIILKPLQPFLDWCSNLYPVDIDEMNKTNIYLISENIDDEEAWLKKKYDKLFKLELEGWHTNKKEWPQKRRYKMFNEWFQVDISIFVYDLEKEPVFK